MLPIFYSYSHKDENFKNELEVHLEILRRQNLIDGWSDRRISPGSNWEEEINFNLEKAKIILLLISSDFLASDYCYETETKFALDQHDQNLAKAVPIILRPCLWNISNFKHLQALPTDGKAITEFDNKDSAWLSVANGILKLVNEIKEEEKQNVKERQYHSGSGDNVSGDIFVNISNSTVINRSQIEKSFGKNDIRTNIIKFLTYYKAWYFSPLRIVKWGSKQIGFKILQSYTSKQVSEELKLLSTQGIVKSTISKKGNPIYKLK